MVSGVVVGWWWMEKVSELGLHSLMHRLEEVLQKPGWAPLGWAWE